MSIRRQLVKQDTAKKAPNYLAAGRKLDTPLRRMLLGMVILVFVSGCAAPGSPPEAPEPSGPAGQTEPPPSQPEESLLARAEELVHKDELPMALSFLKAAHTLDPDNPTIASRIEHLQSVCRNRVAKHLSAGTAEYDRQKYDEARRHFLIVLRYDPDNQKAQHYLKQRLLPKSYQSYKVQAGDTLKKVAKKIYQDPGKDFLVAYFNDLKPDQTLPVGIWLKLPYLEAELAEPFFDVPGELTKARQYLAEERYGDVIGIVGKVLEYDYLNKEAEKLKSEAYYQMALHLLRQGKYEAAMEMIGRVDEDHAGLAGTLAMAHAQELQRAELLLEKGMYEDALAAARRVLVYDPSNRAADDLVNRILCEQGRALFTAKKYTEAIAILRQADQQNACIAEALAALQTELKMQAESHYLKGVKYFLKEDLKQAIAEWETAIQFDPGHVKAKSCIENARHLLQQLDKVD